ncbi:hypothetical protein DAEQUDRAFT_9694 [Daedalea quercina L-15889]|uniref:Uncharacterized protein n=1 Tax=Daedalea quercina L-15889 TaxID=1314783 RepID=A0A165UFY1_9APHY|nr:hypothetical protein DAEQUDRAFT_9694 [Daedalea quercina L-15889]
MQLTFSPALGEIVPLVVRPGKPDALQETYFKATFDSIASYEHARSHGVRVEVWTDLPVEGRVRGEWAAVPFTFHEARSEEYGQARKVLSLPSFVDDSASEGLAVYAKLPVRLGHYHDGHQFSFTYRIVHASGDIRWLGAFGQNGTLVIDHKPLPEALGITLGEGWQFQEDGVAVLKGRPTNTQEVGKLLDSRACWPMFSRTCETQSCVALVLAPRPRRHAIMPNPPLVAIATFISVFVSLMTPDSSH